MSYLRNKEIRRKKITKGIGVFAVLVVLFLLRAPIGRGFSSVAHGIAWPFLKAKVSIDAGVSNLGAGFASTQSLRAENESLKQELAEAKIANLERDVLFNDNVALREALGRGENIPSAIAGVILSKPNASPYGTLVIDIGSSDGIVIGEMVFARGTVPIGTIDAVYPKTSLVKLFSTPKETLKVVIKGGIYIDVIGKGSGNFEATLPRDITIALGDTLTLPSLTPLVLATVGSIISDPRDPFQKMLAVSPVNIQELKFVEVRK